jgi:Periplasmic binding protein
LEDPVNVPLRTLAAVAAAALLAAGCGRSSPAATSGSTASAAAPASSAGGSAGSFGALAGVCHGGHPTSSPGQGVTASQIIAGVLTDEGFTKLPDLVNTAKVFAAWCNAAGGIDGRKIVPNVGDTQMLQVVQAMAAACTKDFVLAGNSEALDGLAVKTRLSCLLPEFPAQIVMPQNINSALQAYPQADGHSYAPYAGYYGWLLKQAYPDSAKHVGIVYGQSPITLPLVADEKVTIQAEGGDLVYSGAFPATGVTDWTPYAEAIKSKGLKGLVFYGTPQQLASLELVLTNSGDKLDWIDANSNAYGAPFIQLGGKSLSYQHNYAALAGYYPLERASGNPADQQLTQLFAKYAPGQSVTLQALQGWSAWLLFAVSAEACGNDLTRKCVYDAALRQTAWTGGGLQSPVNLSQPDSPVTCWNAEEATPRGWQPAAFGPTSGAYRCGAPVFRLPAGIYPPPATLADVGKTMSDVK